MRRIPFAAAAAATAMLVPGTAYGADGFTVDPNAHTLREGYTLLITGTITCTAGWFADFGVTNLSGAGDPGVMPDDPLAGPEHPGTTGTECTGSSQDWQIKLP